MSSCHGRPVRSFCRRVESVEARGKHLLIGIEGREAVRTHLGMHGSWHRYPPGARWRRPAHQASLLLSSAELTWICFNAREVDFVDLDRSRGASRAGTSGAGPDRAVLIPGFGHRRGARAGRRARPSAEEPSRSTGRRAARSASCLRPGQRLQERGPVCRATAPATMPRIGDPRSSCWSSTEPEANDCSRIAIVGRGEPTFPKSRCLRHGAERSVPGTGSTDAGVRPASSAAGVFAASAWGEAIE